MCCHHPFDHVSALQCAERFHIRAYSVYHSNSCDSSHFTNEFMTYEVLWLPVCCSPSVLQGFAVTLICFVIQSFMRLPFLALQGPGNFWR